MTLPITFPAVSFSRFAYGEEGVEALFEESDLTVQGHKGWEFWTNGWLVDAAGRRWRIVKMIRAVWIRGWLPKFLTPVGYRNYNVEFEIVEEPAMTFEALLERTCATIRATPDFWRDDEAIAGESGPPRDEDEMMDEFIEIVRQARNVSELATILDTFLPIPAPAAADGMHEDGH